MEDVCIEKLPCGGELKIYKNSWTIEYYFPGPDLRYNGQYLRIEGEKIDDYIEALQQNFVEYQKLKKESIAGKFFSRPAKMNMTIRIAPFSEGVCLMGHNKAICTQKQLDKLINSYKYAQEKATLGGWF